MDTGSLPPAILNFAAQNEDAAVESRLLDEVARRTRRPLRILSVASCGTNALTMCASSSVARIDAVDVSGPQLMLARLTRSAATALESAEELAALLGNSSDEPRRLELYGRIRDVLHQDVRRFWDENRTTVERGILACGGSERVMAAVRARLPSPDPGRLAADPAGVAAAVTAGFDLENLRAFTLGIPEPIMSLIVERVVPAIIVQLNEHLASSNQLAAPGFILHMFLTGRFPMEPLEARPRFLQPSVLEDIRANGCGPDRLRFHEGPVQALGAKLAAQDGPYDLVDLSNILDMAPPDAAAKLLQEIAESVRPGGFVLCRWSNQPGRLSKLFAEAGIEVDEQLSQHLRAAESSFFMTEVCAGTV